MARASSRRTLPLGRATLPPPGREGEIFSVPALKSRGPAFEACVRESFSSQRLMRMIGARLTGLAPGRVEVTLPFRQDLTQQDGFLHGAMVAAILDNACGYAALSLASPGTSVLTVEYKVNFLTPALGDRLIARGQVIRSGRTITVCSGEVLASTGARVTPVASMLSTIMTVVRRPEAADPTGP